MARDGFPLFLYACHHRLVYGYPLSEPARELLRRRLAGDREVTDANRPLYRELVAARIMYPVSTWVGGPESVFRFTRAGWERREEWINARADALHPKRDPLRHSFT
jgi:hypothetical protein